MMVIGVVVPKQPSLGHDERLTACSGLGTRLPKLCLC